MLENEQHTDDGGDELEAEAQEIAQHRLLNEQLETYGVELPEGSTVAQKVKTLKRLEGRVMRIKAPESNQPEKLSDSEEAERQHMAETWRG